VSQSDVGFQTSLKQLLVQVGRGATLFGRGKIKRAEDRSESIEIMSSMKLFTRLRLFLHVLIQGCRVVDFAKLECEGCKYEAICNFGHYDPR
jgi:hypothetical protein